MLYKIPEQDPACHTHTPFPPFLPVSSSAVRTIPPVLSSPCNLFLIPLAFVIRVLVLFSASTSILFLILRFTVALLLLVTSVSLTIRTLGHSVCVCECVCVYMHIMCNMMCAQLSQMSELQSESLDYVPLLRYQHPRHAHVHMDTYV